jgi:hypothetical protein
MNTKETVPFVSALHVHKNSEMENEPYYNSVKTNA